MRNHIIVPPTPYLEPTTVISDGYPSAVGSRGVSGNTARAQRAAASSTAGWRSSYCPRPLYLRASTGATYQAEPAPIYEF